MPQDIYEYKDAILTKLEVLDKKLSLALQSAKGMDKKLEINKHLKIIRETIFEVEDNIITWDKLQKMGITRYSIENTQEKITATHYSMSFSDYTLLPAVPELTLLENTPVDTTVNRLYSIIQHIEHNYHALFSQKIFLISSKTTGLRDHFYSQIHDINHIFKSYAQFHQSDPQKTTYNVQGLLHKEYILLIKKIFTFFNASLEFITLIQEDETFLPEDLQQLISSVDHTSSIYNIPLINALEEYKNLIKESLEYLQSQEKDIFDAMQFEKNR